MLPTTTRNNKTIISRLQNHLNHIENWSKEWKIAINGDKSQAILFNINNKGRTKINETNLQIDNMKIPWSNDVKYLGITLDKNMKFINHAKNVRNKAIGISKFLYLLLSSNSKLNINNKIKIYKSIIRPIMTYGALCFIQSEKAIKILKTYENKSLKKYMGALWYITNARIKKDLKFTSIDKHMIKLAKI